MQFNRPPIISTALKTVAAAVASAVLVTSVAQAAGLGRLTVLSALGQPLRAEIELTAVGEDESGLQAKLASPDAFRVANIEFNPALLTLRFAVEQRNGRQFIKITSTQPLNEPFVDLLLELSWNGGKLVREYTFLLDPAELRTTQPAQVAGETRPAAQPRAAEPAPEQAAAPAPRQQQRQPRPVEDKPAPEKKPRTDTEYRVKAGDTLGRIAAQVKPEGISLDMMLVALYRANPDAFIGNNMNRLKSGQILAVPDADTIRGTGEGEARNIVVAHAADFNAYRNKLAGQVASAAPVAAPPAGQSAAGKITAKVQERPTAANEAQDQLKLSKAAPAQGTGGKGTASAPEDVIAKEKALAEAQARVKELEKNVSDLEKLMTVKSQAGSAAAKNAAPEPAAKAAPAKPADAKPAQEKKPEPPKKAAPPPPPPAPEPGLLDFVFENIKLIGGAAAVALLAALGIAQRRRKTKEAAETPAAEPSLLGVPTEHTHSLFAETGGQSVDTNNSVFNSSFAPSASQLDTNEVDPVAEADVYIAYGRDAQAEEILKEALRTHPDRYPVRLKLLEIYAARKDQRAFETQAAELYSQTRGQGEEWAQAAALGLSIDPLNPLYAGAGAAAAAPAPSEEEVGQQALLAQQLDDFAPATEPRAATDDDFNLDTPAEPTALPDITAAPVQEPAVAKEEEDHALDFDLGGLSFEPVSTTEPIPMAAPTEAPVAEDATAVPDLDFHVELGATEPEPAAQAQAEPEFEPQFAPVAEEPAPVEEQSAAKTEAFDLAFDMDFDSAAPTPAPAGEAFDAPLAEVSAEPQDKQDDPLALDLSLDSAASDFDMADLAKEFDLPDLPKAVEPEQSAPADELKDPLFDLDVMDFGLPTESPAAEPQAVAGEPQAGDDPFALPEMTATPAPAPAMPAFDLSDIDLDLPEPATAAMPLPDMEAEATAEAVELSPAHMEMETKLDLALAYQEIGDKEGARELLDEVIKGGNSEQVSKATAMREQLA